MADQSAIPKPRKRRRWLRRLLYTFLFFLLGLIIFHRPLVHYGGRWVAIWLAGKEHMNLDLRIEGNVWGRLEIHDLKLRADGKGLAPVESADLDYLITEYNLWRLVRGDLSGIQTVKIGKVAAVITPIDKPKVEKPKKPLAEQLQAFLSRPLPAPVVEIQRVDITVRNKGQEVIVAGVHANLKPGTEGTIGWERIVIPGMPPMEKAEGRLALSGDRLALSDLVVWPEVQVRSIRFARPVNGQTTELVADVALPDGSLTANVHPITGTDQFEALANLNVRGVEALLNRFRVKLPMAIDQVAAKIRWQFTPENIAASAADVSWSVSGKKDTQQPGWATSGTATLPSGAPLQIKADARAAESTFNATGSFDLSKTFTHLGESPPPLPEGNLEFRLAAPDLKKAAAEFGQNAAGKADVAGTLRLNQNVVQLDASVSAENLIVGEIEAAKIESTVKATLPVDGRPPLEALVAEFNANTGAIRSKDFVADRVTATGTLRDRQIHLREATVIRGENQTRVEAHAKLEADGKLTELPTITLNLDAKNLSELGLKVGDKLITGTLRGTSDFRVENGKFNGTGQFTANDLEIGGTRAGVVDIKITAVDGVTTINVNVARGKNTLKLDAQTLITAQGKLAAQPSVNFSIDAPDLADFGIEVKGAPVGGTVKGEGKVAFPDGMPNGTVVLTATDLAVGKAKAGELALDVSAADGVVTLKSARASFNRSDFLNASGKAELKAPFAYNGTLLLDVRELSVFQPILDAIGEKTKIAGAVRVSWTGKGDNAKHEGGGKIGADKLRINTLEITESRIAAEYSPEHVLVPEFLVVAEQLRATGKMDWTEKRLNLKSLEVLLAGKPIITGEAFVPLDPFGKSVLPGDQPISANLEARNLDLARVFRELKLPPQANGTITTTITATGTIEAPVAKLELTAKDLRLPDPPSDMKGEQRAMYAAMRGDVDAKITYDHDKLSASTTIRHAELKPLTAKLDAPLALKPILEGKVPDFKTLPFTASVNLPSSSLAVVPKFAPAVARAEGNMAIAIEATGTVTEPRLSGSVTLDASRIRLANGSVPAISNLVVRIGFSGNTVTVQRLDGETGGGKLSLSGSIVAANLLDPTLDIRLRTDKVLAVRDDAVLVRVDCDVTVKGPLNSATAAGRVALAQSRFNKELQILPILMPGRPKPVPREVSQPMVVSFPAPPLRDWKFDIAIVTTNEDPFLIRGNLAKGQVLVDLKLNGTGLAPYLVGAASMEQFSAQLPVSRLTTRRGLITFSRENPFLPRLEIESETVIRGYTIVARLDGEATAPRLDLSSEPPLPQQEIMSLITTGSLTGEIGQNNTALATRAGLMVLREWYKKLFKRDLPLPSDDGGDSFFDRFNVDPGAVDSRTGRQEVTAQFRVSDRVMLLGDVEMGGGVSGRIQYIFRFR